MLRSGLSVLLCGAGSIASPTLSDLKPWISALVLQKP